MNCRFGAVLPLSQVPRTEQMTVAHAITNRLETRALPIADRYQSRPSDQGQMLTAIDEVMPNLLTGAINRESLRAGMKAAREALFHPQPLPGVTLQNATTPRLDGILSMFINLALDTHLRPNDAAPASPLPFTVGANQVEMPAIGHIERDATRIYRDIESGNCFVLNGPHAQAASLIRQLEGPLSQLLAEIPNPAEAKAKIYNQVASAIVGEEIKIAASSKS